MNVLFWIILLVLGFILLLVELFVIPGTSLIGILGFSALAYGIVQIFLSYGVVPGLIALAAVVAISALLIFWFLKTKSWKKIMLEDKLDDSRVNVPDVRKIKIGDEGQSISRLAPMGHAQFHEEIFEVQSLDGYIDPKQTVKIVKIENAKITVIGV